ncbi:hypothetical protein MSG28_004167 [Choristoneura fumiferana]|uniref:Uncharacterized protein n=1 Tax=Choristoneura fumiferana TaxID=7141 RepID=A0ACC0KIG9_CHOFU|nr:hypothetical protein MSG28_004167 [Choristoneura fumiferana]
MEPYPANIQGATIGLVGNDLLAGGALLRRKQLTAYPGIDHANNEKDYQTTRVYPRLCTRKLFDLGPKESLGQTRACHPSQSCAASCQSSTWRRGRSAWTLSSQRYLGRPTGRRPAGRPTYALLAARCSPIRSSHQLLDSLFLRILHVPTEYLHMKRYKNARARRRSLHVGGTVYRGVDKFRYLGCTITDTNNREEEIYIRIQNTQRCSAALHKVLVSRLLSRSTKLRIYKTVVRPVLMYGCEAWPLTQKEEYQLLVAESKVLRKILGPVKRDDDMREDPGLSNMLLPTRNPRVQLCVVENNGKPRHCFPKKVIMEDWMIEHNKNYTGEEKEYRFKIFSDNLKRINAINQNFKGPWLAQLSDLSDLTYLDFAKLKNLTEEDFLADLSKDRINAINQNFKGDWVALINKNTGSTYREFLKENNVTEEADLGPGRYEPSLKKTQLEIGLVEEKHKDYLQSS